MMIERLVIGIVMMVQMTGIVIAIQMIGMMVQQWILNRTMRMKVDNWILHFVNMSVQLV